jgi:hypothetical protein
MRSLRLYAEKLHSTPGKTLVFPLNKAHLSARLLQRALSLQISWAVRPAGYAAPTTPDDIERVFILFAP